MAEHQREKEALLEKMKYLEERQLEAKQVELDMLLKETREKESVQQFSLRELIAENDNLQQNMESSARDHIIRIFNEQEKLQFELETKMRVLEARRQELMKRVTGNEDLEQIAVKNCYLEAAAEKVMKLAEEHKREKEAFFKKMNDLEKELEAKQALVLEIELLRGKVNVMKHIGEEGDLEMVKKVELLLEEISEMGDAMNATSSFGV